MSQTDSSPEFVYCIISVSVTVTIFILYLLCLECDNNDEKINGSTRATGPRPLPPDPREEGKYESVHDTDGTKRTTESHVYEVPISQVDEVKSDAYDEVNWKDYDEVRHGVELPRPGGDNIRPEGKPGFNAQAVVVSATGNVTPQRAHFYWSKLTGDSSSTEYANSIRIGPRN